MNIEEAKTILKGFREEHQITKDWLSNQEIIQMLTEYSIGNKKPNESLRDRINDDSKLTLEEIEFLMTELFGYEDMHCEEQNMMKFHHPYYNYIEILRCSDPTTARMLASNFAKAEIQIHEMKKKYNL